MWFRVCVLLAFLWILMPRCGAPSEGDPPYHPLEIEGMQHMVNRRFPQAVESLERALFWVREPVAEARVSLYLAVCLSRTDLEGALVYLERVDELCRSTAKDWKLCETSHLLLATVRGSAGIPMGKDDEFLANEASEEGSNPGRKWLIQLQQRADSDKPIEGFMQQTVEMMRAHLSKGEVAGEEAHLLEYLTDLLEQPVATMEQDVLLQKLKRLVTMLEKIRPQWVLPGNTELMRGQLALAEKDLNLAKASFLRGANIAKNDADRKQGSKILRHLAGVHWEIGEVDAALQVLERAIRSGIAFERQLLEKDPITATLRQDYTLSVEQLIQYLAWSNRSASAFGRAEALKARNLLTRLAGRKLTSQPKPAERQESERRRRELRRLETRIDKESSLRERAGLQEELKEGRRQYLGLLMRQRIRSPAVVENRVLSDELGLNQARAWLPEKGTTLISYYATWEELLIWVVDQDRFEMVSVEIPRADLQPKIQTFLDQLTQRPWTTDPEPGDRGARPLPLEPSVEAVEETLYRLLITPVRDQLLNRRLIVVPHSSLHNLPFAALRNPENDLYLAEEFVLSNAPSIQTLGTLRSRDATTTHQGALVVGDPATHLPSLPGAEREAQRVAEVLGTTPLLGSTALESTVRWRLPETSWLHIAAHGVYVEDNPYFSRLELTPDREESGADGHLEIHEILTELDFEAVQMVVLSGCETALGEITRGDEIVGLARAFLYAGSPAVVSTLWPVDDEASGDLMEHFYHQLQAGAPVGEALRVAQLRLLAQEKTQHPFYWAGYVVEGDAGRRWRTKPLP